MAPVLRGPSDVCRDLINVTLSDTALLFRIICSRGQASGQPFKLDGSILTPAEVGLDFR